jgi:hypothetical protein
MRLAAAVCMLGLLSVGCRASERREGRASAAENPRRAPDGLVLTGCSAPWEQLLVQIFEASPNREQLRHFGPLVRSAVQQRKLGHVSGSKFVSAGDGVGLFIAVQTNDPERALPLLREMLTEVAVPRRTRIEQNVGAGAAHYYVWPGDLPDVTAD